MRFLVLSLLCACQLTAPMFAGPREGVTWRKFESVHFTVYSDARSEDAKETLTFLEESFDALASLTPDVLFTAPKIPSLHWEVLLFRNDGACSDIAGRRVAAFTGYMRDHLFPAVMLCVSVGADAFELDTFRHELAHAFVFMQMPRAPLFLHEGLAQLLSTVKWNAEKISLGRPPESVKRGFALRKLPDPSALVTNDAGFSDRDQASFYYDAAWLFAHALYFEPEARAHLPDLFARLRSEPDGRAAFMAWRNDVGAATVDGLMAEHYRKPMVSFNVLQPRAPVTRTFSETPMPAETYGLLLARIFLDRQALRARGEGFIAQALAAPTLDTDGRFWLALLLSSQNRKEEARATLQPLVDAQTADARALALALDLGADPAPIIARLRKLPPTPRTLVALGYHDPHASDRIAEQCLIMQPTFVPCGVLAVQRALTRHDRAAAERLRDSTLAVMPHGSDVEHMKHQLDALIAKSN